MVQVQAELKKRTLGAVPRHVAIIMDGNHRWAKGRRLPWTAGYREGAKNVKHVAQACADAGVEYLTLFAFSTENWNRPTREVSLLMELMRGLLENDVEELNKKEVKLAIVGDRLRLGADLQLLMNRAEQITKDNKRLFLSIAVNYGGRWDITQAARSMAADVREGRLDPEAVDEAVFQSYMSLSDIPPPDLCIRTGGDRRISNFLLWDFAYTELYFVNDFWPDFDRIRLERAIVEFGERQRRFGCRA